MSLLIDSYSESNADGSQALSVELWAYGNSFTGDGSTLNSCKFYARKYGTPLGNVVAKVYSYDADNGNAVTLLATSDAISAATLSTSPGLIELTFSGVNKITLVNGTQYVIMGANPGTDNAYGDDTNCIAIYDDSSSPSHAGHSIDWETWGEDTYSSANLGYDVCFYVYGDDVVTNKPSAHFNGLFNKFGAQLI